MNGWRDDGHFEITNQLNVGGDAIIGGNLTVNGTTTTVNTANLEVEDKNILINKGGNDASAEGAGLTVERVSTHGSFQFDTTLTSKWKIGLLGSESEIVTAATFATLGNALYIRRDGTNSPTANVSWGNNELTGLSGLKFNTDGVGDIGASASGRPAIIYIGTSILNALGSASAPSYSFNGDSDTGIYSTANTFFIATNGIKRLRVDQGSQVARMTLGNTDSLGLVEFLFEKDAAQTARINFGTSSGTIDASSASVQVNGPSGFLRIDNSGNMQVGSSYFLGTSDGSFTIGYDESVSSGLRPKLVKVSQDIFVGGAASSTVSDRSIFFGSLLASTAKIKSDGAGALNLFSGGTESLRLTTTADVVLQGFTGTAGQLSFGPIATAGKPYQSLKAGTTTQLLIHSPDNTTGKIWLWTGSSGQTGIEIERATDTIYFSTAGSQRWNISSAGHLLSSTDGAVNIGASGANRPETIYARTEVRAGTAANVQATGGATVSAVNVNAPTGSNAFMYFEDAGSGYKDGEIGFSDSVSGEQYYLGSQDGDDGIGFYHYASSTETEWMQLKKSGTKTDVFFPNMDNTAGKVYFGSTTLSDRPYIGHAPGGSHRLLIKTPHATGEIRLSVGPSVTQLYIEPTDVDVNAHLIFDTDNIYDVGRNGADNRPRTIYVGTSIQNANGSASVPSYSFQSDPDTGIYRFGANQIGFATNGAASFYINDKSIQHPTLGNSYLRFNANSVDGRAELAGVNAIQLMVDNTYAFAADTTEAAVYRSFRISSTYSATNNHLYWQADGGGNVGTSATAGRPEAVYIKTNLGVNLSGAQNASAIVQLDSTSKGFLPPRMSTAQRDAIASPATGLVIYNSSTNQLNMYDGTAWVPIVSGSSSPSWTKYTISHTALQTAALTNDIQLYLNDAKRVITGIVVKHSTAFAGTGITGYTISVGITGNLTAFATAFDVFQAVAETAHQSSHEQKVPSFGSTTSIRVAAVSTGANLDQSTAGSVDIWVQTSVLP